MDLLVLAKQPEPGRVKTRLCPPCTHQQAADLAEAALADTLDAAVAAGADRVVLALDGRPGPWCPPGVVIVGQGSGDLAQRLATTWRAAHGPAIQIGMDTPQVGAAELAAAMATLEGPADAALGMALDGGWWCIGMRDPNPHVFDAVPTSRSDTGARQHRSLRDAGFTVADLAVRRDVDRWADVARVAAEAPGTRFVARSRSLAVRAA